MSIHHQTKFPSVKTTIFSQMSQLASEHEALNLSQGFPDFDCHKTLIKEVDKAMHKGLNQYAPMAGVLALRERISALESRFYSADYNPESEITITAGATQALFTAILSIVRPGDEVIIFDPSYDCYAPAVDLAGGDCKHIPLQAPDYSIPWDAVKKFITQNTKLIIINTPHNPSGSIMSAADLEKLQRLVAGTDVIILSDEVYEHIVYDGYEHQSIARFPQLAERSFIVRSFGKSFHTTGWKVGYILAPAFLMSEFRKVHQYNVFSVNTPAQYAFASMLQHPEVLEELSVFYQAKRDRFIKGIKGSKFSLVPSAGTYFQNLDFRKISQENDVDFAIRLVREHKIASIPLSVFYADKKDYKQLRFCFAKHDETIDKAIGILCKI